MRTDRLRALLPTQCSLCRGWGMARLCAACLARFAVAVPRCRRCAIEVPAGQPECGACLRDPPPFASAAAAFDYVAPWSHQIARFKFHAGLDLAGVLADRIAAAARTLPARPSLLLPVPLGEARLRERGYNQAWELTRRLGRRLRVRAEPQLLLRLRDTPHQLALPVERRAANVRGAFAVEPRRRAEIAGQDVALVDDVMTTGATVAELARVLLAAGAARVHVWVAARTPRPGDA
jgi:ComF family protein